MVLNESQCPNLGKLRFDDKDQNFSARALVEINKTQFLNKKNPKMQLMSSNYLVKSKKRFSPSGQQIEKQRSSSKQRLFGEACYDKYLAFKESPERKKKRSYYWKINELAILFMVKNMFFGGPRPLPAPSSSSGLVL